MAFIAGKNVRLLANGYDVSGVWNDCAANMEMGLEDATVFNSGGGTVYQPTLMKGSIKYTGFLDVDPTLSTEEARLQADLSAGNAVAATAVWQGWAASNRATFLNTNVAKIGFKAAPKGLLGMNAEFTADNGIFDGMVIHDLKSETVNGSYPVNPGVDFGTLSAPSTNGWAAILQVTNVVTATGLAVTVQHSTDGTTWANLTGATFNTISALGAQVLTGTGSVNRYIRINYLATWGGGSITFSVSFAKW